MSATGDIYVKLAATAGVTALVSTRIYAVSGARDVTTPHIILQQITATPATSHNEGYGSAHRMIQVACFAKTFEAAGAIRAAVIAALDNQALASGDKPTLEDERDGYEESVDLHRADCDFLV